jgi:hypothetical protein
LLFLAWHEFPSKCGEPADYVREERNGTVFACTACGHEFTESYPEECWMPEADEPDFEALAIALQEDLT